MLRPLPIHHHPTDSRPLISDEGIGMAVAKMSSRLSRLEDLLSESITGALIDDSSSSAGNMRKRSTYLSKYIIKH